MSFGFSVGDILSGATLAYRLYQSLSSTKGSAQEYRELIAELNVVHKVLMQVDQLRASNQLAQATLNAMLFIVNSASEAMETFILNNEGYGESLKAGGSGNVVKDGWRKGKWAYQMPAQVEKLRRTLATMLASINCLIQLACYYNTGYDPRCSADLTTDCVTNVKQDGLQKQPAFDDVKLEAYIWDRSSSALNFLEVPPLAFQPRQDPHGFFRPGQVFSVQVTTELNLNNYSHRTVDHSRLPLEPIPVLQAKAKAAYLEDRKKRLAEIQALPLDRMVQYIEEKKDIRGQVNCCLCVPTTPPPDSKAWMTKDSWASWHFRIHHWNLYKPMVDQRRAVLRSLSIQSTHCESPEQSAFKTAEEPANPIFSPETWIVLGDITSDSPIETDREIERIVGFCSFGTHYSLPGPIMIQRFVVVREGSKSCLCIGIHTYAGRGCANQTDQELFAILHSSKEIPAPETDETGITLSPIRMKAEHPSTALPHSARIHFGRAYEVDHDVPVRPLGLIHAGSMETLLSQFENHVFKKESGNSGVSQAAKANEAEVAQDDAKVGPADMAIVKEMRQNIMDVLGEDISPYKHTPPKEVLESAGEVDTEWSIFEVLRNAGEFDTEWSIS